MYQQTTTITRSKGSAVTVTPSFSPNMSNLSAAQSDLTKLASDCNKILKERAEINEMIKNSSKNEATKNELPTIVKVNKKRRKLKTKLPQTVTNEQREFDKQFGSNFSEIPTSNSSESLSLSTPRDASSSRKSTPREDFVHRHVQDQEDHHEDQTKIPKIDIHKIYQQIQSERIVPNPNIPPEKLLSNPDLLSLQKENSALRTENCNFRLKCSEWESKATSLAESLSDMQRELLNKNTDLVELKNIIVVRDNEFSLKMSNMKDKHQNDLNKLNEQARALDERNLALASQIKILEEDLMNRDGRSARSSLGLGAMASASNPNSVIFNNDVFKSHKSIIENLKTQFNNERTKLKQDYINEKEKYELTKIKLAQFDADLEREKNDNRAKNRQIKLLRSDLDTSNANKKELETFTKSESKKLTSRVLELEKVLSSTNESYKSKLDNLTDEFNKVYQIKNELQNENENLLNQISIDTKTFKNAKNLKTALSLINTQKQKLIEERKRLKTQISELKRQNFTINNTVGSEISELIKEKENLSKKLTAKDSKINGYDAKVYELSKEVQKLEMKGDEKEMELTKVNAMKDKLLVKQNGLEQQLNNIMTNQNDQVVNLNKEKHKLMTENNTLKDALRRLSNHSQKYSTEKEDLILEIQELRTNLSNTETDKNDLRKEVSELKISVLKNEDMKHWKAAFESSAEENKKLLDELNNLKETKFQFESKNLDFLHEKKKSRSIEKQLLNKNAEIAKLKSQIMFQNNNERSNQHRAAGDHQNLVDLDNRNLKLAHEATISKSRELLRNNKDLRDEVKRLTSELASVSGTNSRASSRLQQFDSIKVVSRPVDDDNVSTAASINDLYDRYNQLENKFLDNYRYNPNPPSESLNNSTSQSTREVVEPILGKNTESNRASTITPSTNINSSFNNFSPPTPVHFSETSYREDLEKSKKISKDIGETLNISDSTVEEEEAVDVASKTSLEFTRKLEKLAKEREQVEAE